MKTLSHIIFFASLVAFAACGEQQSMNGDQGKKDPGGDTSGPNSTKKNTTKNNGTTDGTTDGDDSTDPDNTNNNNNNTNDPDPNTSATGLSFFEKSVLPVLQAKCVSCHADPRQPAEIRGPLSVYSYNLMKAKLVGNSSKDNDFINKVMNKVAHDGGDRCGGSTSSSPCQEIAAWRIIEMGDDPDSNPGNGVTGRIFEVTPLGKIIGWAYNPDKLTEQLDVVFYVDGVAGTGTKVGPTKANRAGADNNTPGDHAFLFDIPESLRDKKKHQLYAYAIVDGKEVLVQSAPYEFTAYALSAAGRSFYNANVAGAVNGCVGCHALSYEQHFYALVSPAPSQGGTAANNVLINKAGTRNGTAHGGGNRCGGGNPCTVFQQWWDIEFGSN